MLRLSRLIVGALCVIVVIISPFVSKNYNAITKKDDEYKAIITIWQIDSFEGGTGNRTSFLRKVSNDFSKKYKGVLTLVSKHTVESLESSLKKGIYPDIISVGPCGVDFSSYQCEMTSINVEGDGVINKKRYFTAWAKGGYFLISRENAKIDKTIIVEGKNNSGVVASILSEESIVNPIITTSDDGLNRFIFDKNSQLIATQREIVRLKNKGVEFTAKALDNYSDLYEYLSITSKNESSRVYAKAFCDYLLSNEVQSKLTELLLLSPSVKNLYKGNEEYSQLEKTTVKYTISPFSKKEDINKIKEVAKEVLLGKDDRDSLLKLLKHL